MRVKTCSRFTEQGFDTVHFYDTDTVSDLSIEEVELRGCEVSKQTRPLFTQMWHRIASSTEQH